MKHCNVCGVPEEQWVDGYCHCLQSHCEMTDDVIIDARAFAYAAKHNLLDIGSFNRRHVRSKLETLVRKKKVPKYLREAASCDGMKFDSLDQFPLDKLLRVCHDSDDGFFLVGDLVWRSKSKITQMDGINFVYVPSCLDEEFCNESLHGAMFEDSYQDIPRR